MSSNSTASPGADTPGCKATTLLAAAVTSFLFCFVLVLFICFLLQRRRWRRRSASILLLQQQQQRPKFGLDAAAIALIPSFPYRGSARADGDAACPTSGPAECAVCLNILDEGQMARELPGCKPVFHWECIGRVARVACVVPGLPRGRAKPAPARADERAASSTLSSARVLAIEVFDDEVSAPSSSTWRN